MPKKIGGPRFFLSLFIFAVVVGFSVYYSETLIKTLLDVNPGWVLAGILCHGINYILRAFRLLLLLHRRIKFWPEAVYASSFHGLMAYLTPMQLGDMSLPILLKTTHHISLSEGGAILLKSRLLDMISLGGLIVVSAFFFDFSLNIAVQLIWIVIGIVLIVVPILIRHLISRKIFHSERMIRFIRPFAKDGGFKIIELMVSLLIWVSISSVLFCVIRAVNLPLGFGAAFILITIQLPLQLIPVQGLANTGNHEGAWIAALSLLGIPLKQAAEFAVTSHVIILFYVLVVGIVTVVTIPAKGIQIISSE